MSLKYNLGGKIPFFFSDIVIILAQCSTAEIKHSFIL